MVENIVVCSCGAKCYYYDMQDEYGDCDPTSLSVFDEWDFYFHVCDNHQHLFLGGEKPIGESK